MQVAIGALLLALLAWLLLRGKFGPSNRAERELLKMVQGDASTVESMVSGQLKRTPGISRATAVKRVLARLRRDRSR